MSWSLSRLFYLRAVAHSAIPVPLCSASVLDDAARFVLDNFPELDQGDIMTVFQRNLPSLFALVAMLVFSVVVFDSLPEQVPSDYNLAGEVTGTTPRALIVSLLPAIFLAVLLLVNGLLRISPEKYSMPNSKRAVDIILFGTGVLMFFIHVAILEADGDAQRFLFYFSYGMAAFLVITGNVFGKTERNFFIGIRLPWTIASAANWRVTHRLAGKLMVVFGFALAVVNTVYVNLWLMLALCLGPLLLPVLYSPWYYIKHEKRDAAGGADE